MRMRIVLAGTVIGTVTGVGLSRVARWRRTWGIDPSEVRKPLPGDDIVPVTTAIETRGITIDAPPDAVWPWLVQMGFGRGGWYSYDQLDMGGMSAASLNPEWATIAVGDIIPTSPGTGFEVKVLEPGRSLVLFSDTALVETQAASAADVEPVPAGLAASGAFLRTTPQDFSASWAFLLEPLDGGRTRLIERFRVRFGASGPQFRIIGPMMAFGVFVMMRRQMLGIRDRAVLTAVAPRLSEETSVQPQRAATNGRAVEPAGTAEMLVPA
jgi:proline iminopeptidase